jgi:NAD(P)-dependent dehydrogenase (short-subunit alcohol dehydrogenase family)
MGLDLLRSLERVEIVPLDVTDTESVAMQARQNGGRIDIVINTAEHIRPGGIMTRHGVAVAREEMDVRYFGSPRRSGRRWPLAAPTASIQQPLSSTCFQFTR